MYLRKEGLKAQTRRRQTFAYRKGRLYSIQPKRIAKGIPTGKILILDKTLETREESYPVSLEDACVEGVTLRGIRKT